MVRAPCCEKIGLKRGSWSPEEDQILINFIRENGHSNWKVLPKKAGLLRCGKSCRLRWTNYLRPDIKRGDFSLEEEETIINLHERLGNRWSAIAARLPGRTDNEIKNVWHTHLKKRLNQNQTSKQKKRINSSSGNEISCSTNSNNSNEVMDSNSSQEFSQDFSESFFESLWKNVEVWETELNLESKFEFPQLSMESITSFTSETVDAMDFWSTLLTKDGGFSELLEI